jgi:hypothetical protein
VESRSLDTLANVLRQHPSVYWHPIEQGQIGHLLELRSDPSDDVSMVNRHLQTLVAAHAEGLLRGQRIVWKVRRRAPGRIGGLQNPHPADGQDFVTAQELYGDWSALQAAFKEHGVRQREKESAAQAQERIQDLVNDVLEQYGPQWSSRREVYWPDGRPQPKAGALFFNWQERWNIDVHGALDALVGEGAKPRLLRKEGAPAYLAYAVLAALLDVTPEKVHQKIGNFRHPRRRLH